MGQVEESRQVLQRLVHQHDLCGKVSMYPCSEIETSAFLSAMASLIPSPTKQTVFRRSFPGVPSACENVGQAGLEAIWMPHFEDKAQVAPVSLSHA